MIQPVSMSMSPGTHSTSVSDEIAFRRWLTRRDAARQQIRRLSRRELQVVHLVADGLGNKSIAVELQISVKTIEKHRANAARKLGINSTAEMVKIAVLADHELQEPTRLSSSTYFESPESVVAEN
jgi:DNA-binding NarL/FixJ family response regulator